MEVQKEKSISLNASINHFKSARMAFPQYQKRRGQNVLQVRFLRVHIRPETD